MRLLVSVTRSDEVAAALAGGADIVDAKDPARGALGAVSAGRLVLIDAAVPAAVPFSVALGDVDSPAAAAARLARLAVRGRPAGVYVKLGFRGVTDAPRVRRILDQAVAAAAGCEARPGVIAVAYADGDDESPSPAAVIAAAADAGAAGVLLDTLRKRSGTLFDALPPADLAALVESARRRGLLTAIAGSVGLDEVAAARLTGADVLGVRGAACIGGRRGRVSAERVRRIREALGDGALAKSHTFSGQPALVPDGK